jgi:hypothetical protein
MVSFVPPGQIILKYLKLSQYLSHLCSNSLFTNILLLCIYAIAAVDIFKYREGKYSEHYANYINACTLHFLLFVIQHTISAIARAAIVLT